MFGRLTEIFGSFFNKKVDIDESNNNRNRAENDSIWQEKGINGQIDETIYQGEYGDCWLLSGVLAMSYTESGAELIKESITANSDGSVDVSFDGYGKEYTISAEELASENKEVTEISNYSKGDDDMLAIELGVEKIVADDSVKTKFSIQDGGNPYYVYKLYGADKIKVADEQNEIIDAFNYYENNSDTTAMTLGVVDKSVCGLKANHGYTIKEVNTSNVVIVDPWDSSQEINVNKKSLLDSSNNLSVVYAEFAT